MDPPRERPHASAWCRTRAARPRPNWWPRRPSGLAAHGIEVRTPITEGGTDLDTDGLDVVISLGGDGTMLRAVDIAYEAGVPVLGVNVGPDGLPHRGRARRSSRPRSTACIAGDFEVAERMVLEMTVESAGSAKGRWFALNEAVLEKVHTGRLVRLEVDINGTLLHHLRGRRRDRRHAHRLHRVLVLGAWPDRVAPSPVPVAHARCHRTCCSTARSCSRPRRSCASSCATTAASCSPPTGASWASSRRATPCRAGAATASARIVTFGPRDFHQILKAKFGLADR